MSELKARLFAELDRLVLIDPHTHINPHQPASSTLVDLLGYHYYTELLHSTGMPRRGSKSQGLAPKERFSRLVEGLAAIENTMQYSWLIASRPRVFRLRGAADHARQLGTAVRWREREDGEPRLARSGAAAKPARGRIPDQ